MKVHSSKLMYEHRLSANITSNHINNFFPIKMNRLTIWPFLANLPRI